MFMHVCLLVSAPHFINILSTYIFNRRQKGHILLTISMTDESFQTNFDRQQKATAEKTALASAHREVNEDACQTMLWKSIGKQGFLYRRITGLQRQGQEPDESQDPLLALKVSGLPSSNWSMLHGFCSLFFFLNCERWIKLNQVSSNTAKWQMRKQESKNNFLNILQTKRKWSESRILQIIVRGNLQLFRCLCLHHHFTVFFYVYLCFKYLNRCCVFFFRFKWVLSLF